MHSGQDMDPFATVDSSDSADEMLDGAADEVKVVSMLVRPIRIAIFSGDTS